MLNMLFASIVGLTLALPGMETDVQVSIDGKPVSFPDAKPMINSQNHTVVPVRFVTENLGYEVSWNEAKQTIYLKNDKESLFFRIGQYESEIMDSRTYVPLRYVAEAFGAEVQWNAKNRSAIILTKDILDEPTAPMDELEQDNPSDDLLPGEKAPKGWKKKADDVIHLAEKYYGVDYQYGAKAGRTDVFDCSSLTQYVFWKNGIQLKRASRPQFLYDGDQVLKRDELRRGDLVFFSTMGTAKKYEKDDYRRNGHVGIVKEVKKSGEIVFLHTYQKGIGVTDSIMHANLNKGWWNAHFLYGKRVIADDGRAAKDVIVDKGDLAKYVK